MAETYSFPIGTIESDTLNFTTDTLDPTSLSIYQAEQNLVYLNNLSLSGDVGSSGLVYRAKTSIMRPITDFTFNQLEPGKFDVSISEMYDNGQPKSILIVFNNEDLWGDRSEFWAKELDTRFSDNMQARGVAPPDSGGLDEGPQIECYGMPWCSSYSSVTTCTYIWSMYYCPWWCPCQTCYSYMGFGGVNICSGYGRSAFVPISEPEPEKQIRLSRIAGPSASENTYTFKITSVQAVADITMVIAELPNPEDKVCFCTKHKCRCSRTGAEVCCCFWQDCEKKCENGPCKGFGSSGGSIFAFTPENTPQVEVQPAQTSCRSCKKKALEQQSSPSTSSTPTALSTVYCSNDVECPTGLNCIEGICGLRSFAEAGTTWVVSILEGDNAGYSQNVAASTNNSLIYSAKDEIMPIIATGMGLSNSTSAFDSGRFDVALTKISNTFSSFTFSDSFTISVSSTSSWPKYGLTNEQFDYKLITTPHPSSGIAAPGRYYYQLAVDRIHPSGAFGSMLSNLDGGYRVNLNFQVSSQSVVGTYSGPNDFSTILHNYYGLTDSVVNVVMSSTFSLPLLSRDSIATMSYYGTKIFLSSNKYELSFNQISDQNIGSLDSFWLPLISSTSDKLLNIQQIGSINNWKFRISGSSSKLKTNSRALEQGLNVYEYILNDAALISSNITDSSVSPKPNTFPSNVQYNISYLDLLEPDFGQFNFQLRESSLFATASTYSVSLTEQLEEGEIVVKRVVMSYSTPQISASQSTPITQFSTIEHLEAGSVTKTVSQTFVAFKPTLGGKNMDWYNQLESNFMRIGATSSTNPDGSITFISKGKPQRVTLNINNCPPCPDGQTLDFYFNSITKFDTGEVIIGNRWIEIQIDNGFEICDCFYWQSNFGNTGPGFNDGSLHFCKCRQNPNLS